VTFDGVISRRVRYFQIVLPEAKSKLIKRHKPGLSSFPCQKAWRYQLHKPHLQIVKAAIMYFKRFGATNLDMDFLDSLGRMNTRTCSDQSMRILDFVTCTANLKKTSKYSRFWSYVDRVY